MEIVGNTFYESLSATLTEWSANEDFNLTKDDRSKLSKLPLRLLDCVAAPPGFLTRNFGICNSTKINFVLAK